MEGLNTGKLQMHKMYKCLISGKRILITNMASSAGNGGMAKITGTYFHKGEYKTIDISHGQLALLDSEC